VHVDGFALPPFLGLTSWVAFEVTALQNHFFYDDPRVFFMHVGGTGASLDFGGVSKRYFMSKRMNL